MEETQAQIPSSKCVVLELLIEVIVELITQEWMLPISGVSVPAQTNIHKDSVGKTTIVQYPISPT